MQIQNNVSDTVYQLNVLDLCSVAASGAYATDHLSSSSFVFCCNLQLLPAVPETCCSLFSENLFFRCSLVTLFFCGLMVYTWLLSLLLSMCLSHFHFLLLSWFGMGSRAVFTLNLLAVLFSQSAYFFTNFLSIC